MCQALDVWLIRQVEAAMARNANMQSGQIRGVNITRECPRRLPAPQNTNWPYGHNPGGNMLRTSARNMP